jgi:hypothetical protein
MNDYRIPISNILWEFADIMSPLLVPGHRTVGFDVKDGQRGDGDFMELLARITIFREIASRRKICNIILVCGEGDPFDLTVKINKKDTVWDVKASAYSPYRAGLNLFVIKEYAEKPVDGYIQAFVHLNENQEEPHLHIAGIMSVDNPIFIARKQQTINIPGADHPGIKIPVEELTRFETLLGKADDKW